MKIKVVKDPHFRPDHDGRRTVLIYEDDYNKLLKMARKWESHVKAHKKAK